MDNRESIEKIDNLIEEATKIRLELLEASTDGNTILSPEQAKELIRKFRDQKLQEILGED